MSAAVLSGDQKEQMYNLMCRYFDNVLEDTFETDLKEKHWIILLEEGDTGVIRGFSTLMLLREMEIGGRRVSAIFSGDTIVEDSFRNTPGLFRTFLDFSIPLSKELERRGCLLYWFLISMGYRTYRLLPSFFHEFYPRYDRETPPFEKEVIDRLAGSRYPGKYDSRTGVIHYPEGREALKPDCAGVPRSRLRNPHVRFFCRNNPLAGRGDELVCVARISERNLRPIGLRLLPWNPEAERLTG